MLIAVNFHYIRKSFDAPYPSIFGKTPDEFEDQILELKKYGEFVSQHDLQAALLDGEKIPKRAFIITFDDGLNEQYKLALPLLLKHKIPAIFFISTKTVENPVVLNVHKIHLLRSKISPVDLLSELNADEITAKYADQTEEIKVKAIAHYNYDSHDTAVLKYLINFVLPPEEKQLRIDKIFQKFFENQEAEISRNLYLNAEQIKVLGELGFVGSHGHDHLPIGLLPDKEKEREVQKSKEILKELTGRDIFSFSYPYGSEESVKGVGDLLKKHRYQFAFTMERAVNGNFSDPFKLARFDSNDMPKGKAFNLKNGQDIFKCFTIR